MEKMNKKIDKRSVEKNFLEFGLSAKSIEEKVEHLKQRSKEFLTNFCVKFSLRDNVEQTKVVNTILREFAEFENFFQKTKNNLSFFSKISTQKEVRTASKHAEVELKNFHLENIEMNEELYKIFDFMNTYISKTKNTGLTSEDMKYVSDKMKSFVRNGIGRENKEEILKVKNLITKNEVLFSSNIVENKTELLFTKEELRGLKSSFLDRLKKKGNSFIVDMNYVNRMKILSFCSNSSVRKKVEDSYHSICLEENTRLYEETVKLRNKLAGLLDFEDFTEYQLDNRMANGRKEIMDIYKTLFENLDTVYDDELNELKKLKKLEEESGDEFFSYDFLYYFQRRKEKELDIDDDEVKQYFAVGAVINETFKIFQELYGIRIDKVRDCADKLWGGDVELFEVHDEKTEVIIGQFYFDLYSREGKYKSFCVLELQPSSFFGPEKGERQIPICVMLANYSKNSPCFNHNEVSIFYHEFGHLLHQILSSAKYSYFSGYRVEFDFIEVPSFFTQNFVYFEDVLQRISCHVKTKEKLPQKLISKCVKSLGFGHGGKNVALLYSQLYKGVFDLNSYLEKDLNSRKLFNSIKKKILQVEVNEKTNQVVSFGHLMSCNLQYCSGYYSYLYSKIFSIEILYKFFEEDGKLTSCKKVAMELRKKILERGGGRKAIDMITEFLGRKPNMKNFLKYMGVNTKQKI